MKKRNLGSRRSLKTGLVSNLITKRGRATRKGGGSGGRTKGETLETGKGKKKKKRRVRWEKLERRFHEDDSKTLSPTGWGWEREGEQRGEGRGSHTLITRMLYACWWDTYVWALVSKVVCTAYARRLGPRIYPREGRFRHRDFNVSVAARSV